MSRFTDNWDGDYEYAALDQGRWEHNLRAALRGRRGRRALAELREALLALPEHRLIAGALCTVGGVDKRLPALTDEDVAAKEAEVAALTAGSDLHTPDWPRRVAGWAREGREEDREKLAGVIGSTGEGVCAIGAYLWHRRVKGGMNPAQAFDSLPTVFGGEEDGEGDPLQETADLGKDAGLTFTLAWELAFMNDETFSRMTPEERWTAFIEWIDTWIGTEAAAS